MKGTLPMGTPNLLRPGTLTLCSTDIAAPPMTSVIDGQRQGYEPDLARAIAEDLGVKLGWVDVRRWADFSTRLFDNECDAILCNQAVTPERAKVYAYTRPYGRFDEGIVVRSDSGVRAHYDLAGLRVGAITDTTNLVLAKQFAGAEVVEFGSGDNAFQEMADATLNGDIDAMVDDELVLPALTASGELRVAFVVPTQNPYSIALRPESADLLEVLDASLARLIEAGTVAEIWARHFPGRTCPQL
ncbi:substrate-binding periplasmic protein [Paenarthrobacter sp. NEAU-H11]|uniref:substrate-binding periplasmic protein n=1 Tax=Paenarthrobacter sp. NEAU-H11 TaxID=3423924 RepID=UPI003D33498F